jgi:hypothetical protein
MSDIKVVAKNVRIAFPHLVNKHASAKYPTSKPKFGINLLIHKKRNADVIKAINAAVEEVCRELSWTKNTVKALPLVEAETVVKEDGTALIGYDKDHLTLTAKCDSRPLVVDRTGILLDGEEIEKTIYGGCRCHVSFSVYPAKQYRKICCDLRAVKFWEDDEAFAGRAPITDPDAEFGDAEDEGLL